MSETEELKEFNRRINNTTEKDHNINKTQSACVQQEIEEPDFQNDEKNIGKEKMWAVHGGNAYTPCDEAIDGLPAGQYTIKFNHQIGVYFSKHNVSLDELMILPDSVSEQIIEGIEHFWNMEHKYREFEFLWKRGVLLWGPAGSGKTSTLQILSKKIIERNGLAIYVEDPRIAYQGLETLRRIEPDRPIVVMIEDIDAIVYEHGESSILALLDGELQIDNVVYIATTNYPEKLDNRLVNRPSRFDVVRKVGMPSAEARELYLRFKNPRLENNTRELADWVEKSDGFSIAHMKEMIISIEVLGANIDDTVLRLRSMMDEDISSMQNENKQPFGFLND